MSKLQMYAPFSKVVETNDGGREVWGFASLERVDKANEIADFEGTVKAFEDWSNEIAKYSQGKSMGNIREMHSPKAVAKLIHWEPGETTVKDDQGKDQIVKGIYVGTKIPPSQKETIEKVDEGILTGFSIGGGYAKRWKDLEKNAMRFIPKLTELSYVDNPCVPDASFTMIKAAITPEGPVEAEVFEPTESPLQKKAPKGSYEELAQRIQGACKEKFTGPYRNYWDGYVVATFPDHVVVKDWEKDKFWDIPYTVDAEDCLILGEPAEVEKVENFVPVEAMKMMKAAKEDRDKLKEAADARSKNHNIAFKEGKGHLTPPKGKPMDESAYGDPVNYAYPIDSSHIKAAVSYFNHDGQREDGGYSEEEWSIIGKRIAQAAGEGYSYADGKIQTPSDDKRKEMEKSMNEAEELVKSLIADAMKAAQGEQVGSRKWEEYDKETLNKAANLLEAAIKNVDEVAKREQQEANAGDKDDEKDAEVLKSAKEVLTHILEEVKKVATGEKTEQTPPAAEKGVNPGELQKRGAALSKKRSMHLHHAKQHLDAAINGSEYTTDDHAEFEKQMSEQEPSNMEQETNAEKGSFFGDLRKGIVTDVSEALSKFEGLGELAKAADLFKAVEAINGVAKNLETVMDRLDSMEKRLKTIEEQPVQGGPISNPSAVTKLYQMNPQELNKDAVKREVYEELLKSDEIPLGARQVLAKNMALQSHPLANR